MEQAEKRFLELLKAALWNKSPLHHEIPTNEKEWGEVLSIAQKQSTLGLIFDVAQKLPIEQQPSTQQMRKLLMHNVRSEQMHRTIEQSLAEVTRSLAKRGITGILLKGEGTSLNYPRPYARACGDIDLYIGEDNYLQACQALAEDGLGTRSDHDDTKHVHIDLKSGVVLEIHRKAAMTYRSWKKREFESWLNHQLSIDSSRHITLNDQIIAKLPTATFDAFFIFYHAYFHFISGGLGIRQICDWMLHLNRYYNDIDQKVIHDMLQQFGLIKQWQIFGRIAVYYLGLDPDKLPFYQENPSIEKKASLILTTIFAEGNFGFYADRGVRPRNYFAGKIHTWRIISTRAMRLMKIDVIDIFHYYNYFLIVGTKAVLQGKKVHLD